MRALCGFGLHAFRFYKIRPGSDPLGRRPNWWISTRCKRCGLDRRQNVTRIPRLIRTHEWGEK